jgi:Transmembrane secretion effector
VLGAIVMQAARARWTLEVVASSAVVILAVMVAAAGLVRSIPLLSMLVAGAGWLVFISLVNSLVQTLAPEWARARVLAVFILTFQGGLAPGGAAWGVVAARIGISATLVIAGLSTLATIAIRTFGTLPQPAADTRPWSHWRLPTITREVTAALEQEPALVTVRYHVRQRHEPAFLRAIEAYGRIRRRDGASYWGIFRDVAHADVFLETFLVTSWAEHLRQHARFTRGDGDVEAHVRRHIDGEPLAEHFVGADAISTATDRTK